MGNNYTFTAANGVIIPDTADILESVQNEYREALGADLSLEPSTPQGRLIDIETTARVNTINYNAQVANFLINISLSAGQALDAWGANFGLSRTGATSSRVLANVSGVPNTVIPANSEASTSNGIIWRLENEIILDAVGSGSGIFLCSQYGPITLGINELDTVVASSTVGVNGWETVNNTEVATVGSLLESDESFKIRILNSIFSGSALFGNYASACYKVENVQDVFAYDNPYGTEKQLDNITIPPHSVFVCVDGGNSEEIAQALYSVKSAGCGWAGNTTVTVKDFEYNTLNTVAYNIPISSDFTVEVNLTNVENSNDNLEQAVKEVILNYFNNNYLNLGYSKIGIRATISAFTLASLLKSQLNGIVINSVLVGLKTPTPHATASIIKASVTSGITWASVNADIFSTVISSSGTYNFIYNGTDWTLGSNAVELSEYGIVVAGEPITNDKISILYSTGVLGQSPIQIYATETASIDSEDIKVIING